MIEIDGSEGEGGGQILRTALSLSCLFGAPFAIRNIRKNRARPGLMPQHLAAVRAAQRISAAAVSGDAPGSTGLSFAPGGVRPGEYAFDIGTAGSATLLLQSLLPPLVFAAGRSAVVITGGTHVPFSPTYQYLAEVFLPFLARMGIEVRLSIASYGFRPRGGGRIRAEIRPAGRLAPLSLPERGAVLGVAGCSGVGGLPGSIAVRQRDAAVERIRSALPGTDLRPEIGLLDAPTPGRGTFLFLRSVAENAVAGFASLGAIGKRAEAVGAEAAEEFLGYLSTGAALDPHLPDQVVPYLALCGGESVFTTSRVTAHLLTNVRIIGLFRPFSCSVDGGIGAAGKVTVRP